MFTKRKQKQKEQSVYTIGEKKLILYINSFVFLILFINKCFIEYLPQFGSTQLDNFFVNDLVNSLNERDGTLITLAAVFIGIYFTVFSLLSSLKVDSTFSILTKENFETLIDYIRNAFIGSFLYLLYSLFIIDTVNNWLFSVLGLVLLLYMLLSALRFGSIIYLIFSRDVKKYYDSIEENRKEEERRKYIFDELKAYLDDEELSKKNKKAASVNDRLKAKYQQSDNK